VGIDWNAEVVDQLEWHWQHQLRPRLDGLTDDEYFWRPVPGCWTLSRRGEIFGPPNSPHFDTPRSDQPALELSGTAEEALRQLDEGHEAWIADVRALGADGLA